MNTRFARIAFFLAIAAALTALIRLMPTEEDRIRGVILKARAAISSENRTKSPLDTLARVGELTACLTRDIIVNVDVFSLGVGSLQGAEEVRGAVLALPQVYPELKVRFDDIRITLEDPLQARAWFVAIITPKDRESSGAQEFALSLRRIDGRWFISRIETVRSLKSQ